jgi:hypothetical protein
MNYSGTIEIPSDLFVRHTKYFGIEPHRFHECAHVDGRWQWREVVERNASRSSTQLGYDVPPQISWQPTNDSHGIQREGKVFREYSCNEQELSRYERLKKLINNKNVVVTTDTFSLCYYAIMSTLNRHPMTSDIISCDREFREILDEYVDVLLKVWILANKTIVKACRQLGSRCHGDDEMVVDDIESDIESDVLYQNLLYPPKDLHPDDNAVDITLLEQYLVCPLGIEDKYFYYLGSCFSREFIHKLYRLLTVVGIPERHLRYLEEKLEKYNHLISQHRLHSMMEDVFKKIDMPDTLKSKSDISICRGAVQIERQMRTSKYIYPNNIAYGEDPLPMELFTLKQYRTTVTTVIMIWTVEQTELSMLPIELLFEIFSWLNQKDSIQKYIEMICS